jgi:hypothetical protein
VGVAVKKAEPVARANEHAWHVGCGAAFGAKHARGSSLTLGRRKESPVSENLYEKFKREREESEKDMWRMQQEQWRMEREKKERAEATVERRHRELIKSMKKNSGVHISSGGDTNISGSNVAGGNLKNAEPKSDGSEKWYKKPVGMIVIGLSVATLGYLVHAALKHFYPGWFS